MDAPLGRTVGNALEVRECIDTLKGQGPSDLEALSVELAARMVRLGGLASDAAGAEAKVRDALTSGRGLEVFQRLIEQQGGNPRVVDDPSLLPAAPHRERVTAERSGYVAQLDAEAIGRAAMVLGAGRDRAEDAVDPAVGAVVRVRVGDVVRPGEALVELHYRDSGKLEAARQLLATGITIADAPQPAGPLVLEVIE
jgi:pyrimidine-nucleoside phosphorylase